MSTVDERNVDPIEEMTRVAGSFLDLALWGFKESDRSAKPGNLIYDSEWCRVNFVWGGWDQLGGNSISIYYGRLHAPNEKATMTWNGEECHCWHRVELALHLLDRQTPEYASKMIYTHSLIEQYKQSDIGQSLTGKRRQPEWLVRMHAMIWKRYAPRLFELFDLRRPDLWEQYRQFLKEVYDIKGRSPNIKPPLDKIC
ncbi:MAG: hypothetical protein L0Z71_17580 [Anaerolineae bacterium]|nr:hypothetical protein [Anaerolineae bacterium]